MPELPEVEVVRSGLAPAITGAIVEGVEVLDIRSLRRHDGPPEDFIARLTGSTFAEPQRRGKFLWVPLEEGSDVHPPLPAAPSRETQDISPGGAKSAGVIDPPRAISPEFPAGEGEVRPARPARPAEALVVHLGMSGQVLLRDPDAPRDRLTRVVIAVRHPEHGPLRVDFVDQRIFGSMALDDLVPTVDHPEQLVPSQVAHIARDPIDPLFDDRRFLARLRAKDTGIKRALLDQTLVSGIGNIYADEALWAARVHYAQPTKTLSRPRAVTLLAEVRSVLGRALDEGGTSFDATYVNVNGASGYFSHSLNAYGQQGRPCPRCGHPIVREQFMNRGSHFCPHCQRVR